jgi:hypothetical protein
MRLPGLMMLRREYFFKAWQDVTEGIYHQGLGLIDYFHQIIVTHSAYYNWQLVRSVNTAIDFLRDSMNFLEGIDKRDSSSLKLVIGKLRKQT